MIRFDEFLSENYKNLTSIEDKQKYKEQVWDVLDKSYQYIGGIKGSGFESIDAMLNNIPY